jgi:hypothetical protein
LTGAFSICNNICVTKAFTHADAEPDAPPEPATADPAAAIVRADQRLAMLRRLAELGMKLAEALAERVVSASKDPEPRHDPAGSFARVSRAVRLTLALEAKIEQDLAALRQGGDVTEASAPKGPPWPEDIARGAVPKGHPRAHRNQIRDSVWDAINHEITDIYPAQEILDDLHERLVESDRYDAFLYRPLRESVEAICADLGLTPDWSRWTDDGFPPETRTTRYDWPDLWGYNAKHAEARRQRKAAASETAAAPPDAHHAKPP